MNFFVIFTINSLLMIKKNSDYLSQAIATIVKPKTFIMTL